MLVIGSLDVKTMKGIVDCCMTGTERPVSVFSLC